MDGLRTQRRSARQGAIRTVSNSIPWKGKTRGRKRSEISRCKSSRAYTFISYSFGLPPCDPLGHLKMSAAKGKEKEKPIASLLAGATAGGVESFITYPFESLKTQLQFGALNGEKVSSALCLMLHGIHDAETIQPSSPYQVLRQTLAQRGLAGLYAGCTAVVIGNAVKAGVRFTTYDQFKLLLRDDEVGILGPWHQSPEKRWG